MACFDRSVPEPWTDNPVPPGPDEKFGKQLGKLASAKRFEHGNPLSFHQESNTAPGWHPANDWRHVFDASIGSVIGVTAVKITARRPPISRRIEEFDT
jgi:hypothetical protein